MKIFREQFIRKEKIDTNKASKIYYFYCFDYLLNFIYLKLEMILFAEFVSLCLSVVVVGFFLNIGFLVYVFANIHVSFNVVFFSYVNRA